MEIFALVPKVIWNGLHVLAIIWFLGWLWSMSYFDREIYKGDRSLFSIVMLLWQSLLWPVSLPLDMAINAGVRLMRLIRSKQDGR